MSFREVLIPKDPNPTPWSSKSALVRAAQEMVLVCETGTPVHATSEKTQENWSIQSEKRLGPNGSTNHDINITG
ncbi:hypothetical protein RRG08_042876 [Elysia crispata]|uniref:Uncharacterized protein n=1 Tax=Elysia crispata TaxID=231223 RepID=A0AAE0YUC9_9GAST|nr:hypothetical protein RRG08_042876 [Elysia crispata]